MIGRRKSSRIVALLVALLACVGSAQALAQSPAAADGVIAIDVLLEPNAVMVTMAQAANAALRKDYPQGYTLGKDQVPHITLVQRYVREQELPKIEAAVAKVFSAADFTAFKLTATGYAHAPWAGVQITGLAVERTPELDRLQQEIVDVVEPYAVKEGSLAAFSTSKELPKVEEAIVDYVKNFVLNSSGEKYNPHVTVGVATAAFAKRIAAEPFTEFSFKPRGAAIYHLGAFGTAQKKLWQWKSN